MYKVGRHDLKPPILGVPFQFQVGNIIYNHSQRSLNIPTYKNSHMPQPYFYPSFQPSKFDRSFTTPSPTSPIPMASPCQGTAPRHQCPVLRPLGTAGTAPAQLHSLTSLEANVRVISYWMTIYLVVHPTNRKWVSSPQFFQWINPTKIPFITGVITHLLSGMSHQVGDSHTLSDHIDIYSNESIVGYESNNVNRFNICQQIHYDII